MSEPTLVESILGHSTRTPAMPALTWQGEDVTYGTLATLASRACADLARLDLTFDETVAVQAEKSPASVALLLGCLMAGQPVLVPSRGLGSVTLAALLRRTGCRCLLSTGAPDAPPGDGPADRRPGGTPGYRPRGPFETAFLFTTSGSTGVPKVVPLTVGAVDRFTAWAGAQFGIAAGTTVLSYAPLNFDLSLLDVWTTLSRGGTVLLVDEDRAIDQGYLRSLFATSPIQVVQGVPMLFRLLLDAVPRGTGFPQVRQVVFTGDVLPRTVLNRLPDLFPNARLNNVYGCTETNDSFMYEVQPAGPPAPDPLPIGLPLPGVHAQVRAADGHLVRGSGTGELLVSTPFQTRGYIEDGSASDRFVRLADGRVYFRSGDLVRRHADGHLTLIGRNDFQVKVRGVRVNLLEIERVLLENDQVAEATVVTLPAEHGEKRLVAYARPVEGSRVNSLELRAHCAARLERAAIPSTIHIIDHPLPRTSTGKVDRERIRITVPGGA